MEHDHGYRIGPSRFDQRWHHKPSGELRKCHYGNYSRTCWSHTPTIHCKVFEDNSGALEIASVHKARPRTKHINVRLHHFCDYVDRKEVSILPMRTEDMPADFLTKPVNKDILWKHRGTIMGWATVIIHTIKVTSNQFHREGECSNNHDTPKPLGFTFGRNTTQGLPNSKQDWCQGQLRLNRFIN